jgi:hypothetical protein
MLFWCVSNEKATKNEPTRSVISLFVCSHVKPENHRRFSKNLIFGHFFFKSCRNIIFGLNRTIKPDTLHKALLALLRAFKHNSLNIHMREKCLEHMSWWKLVFLVHVSGSFTVAEIYKWVQAKEGKRARTATLRLLLLTRLLLKLSIFIYSRVYLNYMNIAKCPGFRD